MVGLLCLQRVKHQVHGVLELLVILPDLHRVDELDEGGEILFLHRGLVVDIPNEGAVQKRLGLNPKIVPGLALALGVGDQRRDQFQDVLFGVDVGKGIIVHGLLEVDGIEDFDPIRLIDVLAVLILHGLAVLAQLGCAALKHFAALHQDGAFWVCHHIGAVHLHQVRFQPEAGLAGTGATDHQHIFVSGGLGVLGAAVHGQALGFSQNHIVLEHRVDVGCDVLMGAPAGAAILHTVPVLLGVLAFEIHGQSQASAAAQPHQQVQRVQAGPPAGQRHRQRGEERKHFCRSVRTHGHPPSFTEVGCEQPHQDIGHIQQKELFDVKLLFHLHRSSSFRLFRSTTACFTSSLNWLSFASTDGRSVFCAFLTFLPVYSVKAAVRASASRPLKKIRYLGGELLRSFFTA